MLIKFCRIIFFVSLIILTFSSEIISQDIMNPDSSLQVILNKLEGDNLSIQEAKDFALKNATSVKSAEAVYLAAKGSLRKERGYFDPEFYFSLIYQDLQEPTASFFAGADVLITEQTSTLTGLKLKLPVGTEFDLSLNTINQSTNSGFAFLNPEYNAFGNLSFRQPLLSGFSVSGREELTKAELQYEAAEARYKQEVIAVEAVTEQLYWNLYTSERDYAVQKLTLDRAEAFLKETELRHKAGLVGPSQVANAKTFLAEQKLLLIDRKEQLDGQSDQMASLIGIRPEAGYVRFKATDNPPGNFKVESVDELIEKAVNSNLELKAAQNDVDAAQTSVDAAEWEALPSVDLIGSLTSKSIGGSSQDVIFGGDTLRTTSGGSFGDVLSQIFNRKFPGWSVGIELSMPIGLRTGLGEKDRLDAQASGIKQKYIELTRILEQQVRAAHRELSNGSDRLKAASEGVEAAQEQVRIGMIEFQNGKITAFELVRLSEDFAVAQRRYSEALVKTVNAAATLKQLTSGKY